MPVIKPEHHIQGYDNIRSIAVVITYCSSWETVLPSEVKPSSFKWTWTNQSKEYMDNYKRLAAICVCIFWCWCWLGMDYGCQEIKTTLCVWNRCHSHNIYRGTYYIWQMKTDEPNHAQIVRTSRENVISISLWQCIRMMISLLQI